MMYFECYMYYIPSSQNKESQRKASIKENHMEEKTLTKLCEVVGWLVETRVVQGSSIHHSRVTRHIYLTLQTMSKINPPLRHTTGFPQMKFWKRQNQSTVTQDIGVFLAGVSRLLGCQNIPCFDLVVDTW